jgi:DNA invertase Pin-like site-specific DNA recombinase
MKSNRDYTKKEAIIRKRCTKGRSENAEFIPATIEQEHPLESDKPMNVAAYARVSTDSTQQMSSQIIQEEHYADFISQQKNWSLVGIFSDEGISGTSLKKREGFKQMISACLKGEIDLILTKSVSRFTRNVKDGRETVDILAQLNPPVGIWFETERIYSLSSDSDFLLDLMMTVAAEESRIKSASMTSSLKMRFSREILLTPPLLGYDNDDEGNLVVNEAEARIVKLIFRMYQRGYSIKDISEKLEALGVSTKLGNKKWSHSSVSGILQNERHCGRVVTWKTFTPNYKTHSKRKNRGEREQFVYHNHHQAIITPGDFNAVQKMIANAKYGCRSFMPELYAITDGLLHGFVSVNPRWATFTAEDYRTASKKAGAGDSVMTKREANSDYSGYQIVRPQFLGKVNVVALTLIPDKKLIRISGACIKKFDLSEFAEMLVHPHKQLVAVRICDTSQKNKIKWGDCAENKIRSRYVSGAAFTDTLYELFGLHSGVKHKFRGIVKRTGGESVVIFDMSEPEIISGNSIVYPKEWNTGFGEPYYDCVSNAGVDEIGAKIRKYNTEPNLSVTSDKEIVSEITRLINHFTESAEVAHE